MGQMVMVTKMMVITMKEIVVVMVIMMTVCNNIKKCRYTIFNYRSLT